MGEKHRINTAYLINAWNDLGYDKGKELPWDILTETV